MGELSRRCAESLPKFAAVNQKEGKMAMEGKMSVIKYLMFFFNVLFWLSGLALIIVGALIKSKYGTYLSFANAQYADAVIFIMEVAAGAMSLAYKKKVVEMADKALKNGLKKYQKEKGAKEFFDWLQQGFDCCGIDGQSDWTGKNATISVNGTSALPASCCKTDNTNAKCVNKSGNLYIVGCKQKFLDFVKDKLVLIGAVALAIAFLQILGIIFACCMMREIRGQYEVV